MKPNSTETILIVDDTAMNLRILINYLNQQGYHTLVEQSGEKAIEQLNDGVLPDLILLDIVMPGMDGFETCMRIKKRKEFVDIPIIFMSALSDTIDKVKGLNIGAVDYITKPFQCEELLARVRAHLTIRKQKKQLQELNATKDKLFSIIAHDLRNHFNGIILASSFLLDSIHRMSEKEITYMLININKNAIISNNLLTNLLEWARVQTGRIAFKPTPIDVNRIVDETLSMMNPNAEEKGISLKNNIQEPITAYADPNMLDTIIRNLLSNALKFTHTGGEVSVSAKFNNGFIEVSVSDTGVGMTEGDLANLFRIDVYKTSKGTSDENGTGLGLILCKEFVEKNSGKIIVESQFGLGSVFKISLPGQPSQKTVSGNRKTSGGRHLALPERGAELLCNTTY